MVNQLLTHLTDVPVTLTRSTAWWPFFVSSIGIQHTYQETVVKGNPRDWISRKWLGGTVELSGIFTYQSTSDLWMNSAYFASLQIGSHMTLRALRPKVIALEMIPLGENVKTYGGQLVFTFATFSV